MSEQLERYALIHAKFMELKQAIMPLIPEEKIQERHLVLVNLNHAEFWARKSSDKPSDPPIAWHPDYKEEARDE